MKFFFARVKMVGFVAAAGLILLSQQDVGAEAVVAKVAASELAVSQADLDPTVLRAKATGVLASYCVSCHGPEKQKGKVRLDALETIDPVDQQTLYGNMKEALHLEDMPPKKAKQPSKAERKVLMQWLESQLTGAAAKGLAEKLLRFEYGNVVKHEDLFSGEYADLPGYTPDRRWMISEFIFNEKVNRLLDYQPSRTIYGKTQRVRGDSGIHWSPKTEHGNKFRRTISNPFLLPQQVGVRYSVHERLNAGHLLTMVGNAKRIAGHMSSEATMKAQYTAMHALMKTELEHRETLRSREQFMTTPGFMDRLLKDIYGDEHELLLPKLVRVNIPFPGIRKRKFPGEKTYRIGRPQFINGLDEQDVDAIFRSIVTYKKTPYKVSEDMSKVTIDDKGSPWTPYLADQRAHYEKIIMQAERDWVMYGVSNYRIQNRVNLMKIFWDHWDMELIYREAKQRGPAPAYKPLNDAEMQVVAETIKKHRKKGDTYQAIIDECMVDWAESFKHQLQSAGGAEKASIDNLINELYDRTFERRPTNAELKENRDLLKLYMSKLERQQAIAKLIESLVLNTEFAYRN